MIGVLRSLQVLISLACVTVFLLMAKQQYDTFREEPTGSSLSSVSLADMPFPAITICDYHYEYGKAYSDLGFPRNIFGKPPPEVAFHPLNFYDRLTTFDLAVMPHLWKYYFTLDKIITERDDWMQRKDHRCRMGSVGCGYLEGDRLVGEEDEEVVEVEVPAGKWVSRFLADSYVGANYLCHTLIPNVTINFEDPLGNSIALMWKNNYVNKTYFWKVYVHDRRENVLLNSYAIKTTPTITISNLQDDSHMKLKKKVMVLPRLTRHPAPSDVLPCGSEESYSENWCKIQWGWQEKLRRMEQQYGDKFACRIPGIWTRASRGIPICSHYEADTGNNGTLGLKDLVLDAYVDEK